MVSLWDADEDLKPHIKLYVEGQILFYLARVVGGEQAASFLERVERSKGCIVGGVPRCIMANPNQREVHRLNPPSIMDVVVPADPDAGELLGRELPTFLTSICGYIVGCRDIARPPHHHTTVELCVFVHPVMTLLKSR